MTTYALYRSQFGYGRVDGRYASTTAALRIVMGADTYAHAASQYRGNNDNTLMPLMALMGATAGVRVSAHVPATAVQRQAKRYHPSWDSTPRHGGRCVGGRDPHPG